MFNFHLTVLNSAYLSNGRYPNGLCHIWLFTENSSIFWKSSSLFNMAPTRLNPVPSVPDTVNCRNISNLGGRFTYEYMYIFLVSNSAYCRTNIFSSWNLRDFKPRFQTPPRECDPNFVTVKFICQKSQKSECLLWTPMGIYFCFITP